MTDGPTALVAEMAAWLAGTPLQPKVSASSLSANVAQLLLLPQLPSLRVATPGIFAVAHDGTVTTLLPPFGYAALTAACEPDDRTAAAEGDPAALARVCACAAAALHTLCADPALFVPCPPLPIRIVPFGDAHTDLVARILRHSVELEGLLSRVRAVAATTLDEEEPTPPSHLLLRDLVASPAVRNALGRDYVFLATLLCGVPCGMNLRNVAWHGFAAPHELAPAHDALLRALIRPARAWLAFAQPPAPMPPAPVFAPGASCELFGAFVRALTLSRDAIMRYDQANTLVRRTRFLSRDREAHVAALLTAALADPTAGTASQAVCVLLPQLEHALRRVFVAANALPPHVLAPDYRRYYTTLEILLQPLVVVRGDQLVARSAAAGTRFRRPKFASHHEGEEQQEEEEEWERPNRLADVLGAGTTMLLHDIFTHAAGPRLRDRVAHGTTDPAYLPISLVAALLCVFIRLCVLFWVSDEDEEDEEGRNNKSAIEMWTPVVNAVDAHVSYFHPARLCYDSLTRAASTVAAPPQQQRALLTPRAAALLLSPDATAPENPLREYALQAMKEEECSVCARAAAALAAARAQDCVRTQPALFVHGTPARLAAVQQLARVAERAAVCAEAIAQRIEALVVAVHTHSATRRAQSSCYRALPARHVWLHCTQRICATALARFPDAQEPVRAWARCEALLGRAPALCTEGAWDRLTALLCDAADAIDPPS